MKEIEQLKSSIKHQINSMVNWAYGNADKGDYECIGDALGDFAEHIQPIIEEKIDEAFNLGKKSK